jgi:hypothetical protein
MKTTTRLLRVALLLSVLALPASHGLASTNEVHLVPEDKAPWSPGRMFGFLRPGHNYGDRRIAVETTPSDAVLDLYYVRAGFQKRYEQVGAPATVVLPSRSEATKRDTVTIRASAEGWKAKEVTLRVRGSEERLLIELEPLSNTLHAVAHTYFGGRGSLSFLTKEAPQVRLQKGKDSLQVALHETARGEGLEASFAQVRSPLVAGLAAQQLGDDLLVRVALPQGTSGEALELRSRQSHDAISDGYLFSLEMVPAGGDGAPVAEAQAALAQLRRQDVSGCALVFDDTLRASLEPADLARALAPRGAFTDPYLQAAMKRLGEVGEGGRIRMLDGSEYAPGNPIELSAAMSQASQARGFLAALRRFVSLLEPESQRRVALRSLVAPQLGAVAFDEFMDAAQAAESSCARGSG